MLPEQSRSKLKNDNADAFYGLSDAAFAEQLHQIGASDPKLIRAFQNTRDRYLRRDN